MKSKQLSILFLSLFMVLLFSCRSITKITQHYYTQNEKVLISIEKDYKAMYLLKPFAIEFTDNTFNYISIEIITDTIKYIYEFNIEERRLSDTLNKYRLDPESIYKLINNMRLVKCIWINQLDYYIDEQKNALIFMAVKPVGVSNPFTNKKYYILSYFSKPQYFDTEGNLLARKKDKKLREINGDIFRRINNKVCYTISDRFR